MGIAGFFLRIRSRSLWSDPIRKIQTLESFSQTEIDAGESILRSLKHVDDPQLRAHLERHAKDELRHGDLFRIYALKNFSNSNQILLAFIKSQTSFTNYQVDIQLQNSTHMDFSLVTTLKN